MSPPNRAAGSGTRSSTRGALFLALVLALFFFAACAEATRIPSTPSGGPAAGGGSPKKKQMRTAAREKLKADHRLATDMLSLLPDEASRLASTQRKMLESVAQDKKRLAALEAESAKHQSRKNKADTDLMEARRQRMVAEMKQNQKRLHELEMESDKADQREAEEMEREAAEQRKLIADVKRKLGLHPGQHMNDDLGELGELEEEEKEAEEDLAARTKKRKLTPEELHELAKDYVLTDDDFGGGGSRGGGKKGKHGGGKKKQSGGGSAPPASGDGGPTHHKFDGLPTKISFQIGNEGMLDCTCHLRDTGSGGGSGNSCSGGAGSGSGPWMPAPHPTKPFISPPACYDSCQQHKCTPVFHARGWESWHKCINYCVKRCYHKDLSTEVTKYARNKDQDIVIADTEVAFRTTVTGEPSKKSVLPHVWEDVK